MIAWMLYAAAVGGLVAAGAAAAAHAVRAIGWASRGVWAAALALSLALPVAGGWRAAVTPQPRQQPVAARLAEGGAAARPTVAVTRIEGSPAAPTPRDSKVDPALATLWGAGTLLLLLGMAASALVLARQRRRWRPARVAGASVLVSERLGPAVAGVLRPRIVLPAWVLERSDAEQRLVVAHEQEHVRARDPLLLAGGWFAAALLPWSPAVWWQLRRLRLAVELDCDARVLRAGHDVAAYGGLLLTVGEIHLTSALGAAALAEPRSFLARRIRAMTHPSAPRRAGAVLLAAGAVLLLAAAATAIPAPPLETLRPAAQAGSDTLPVYDVSEVDRAPRLANPAEVREALESAYPAALRSGGVTGMATVEVIVERDGAARLVRLVDADRAEFGDAARSVVPRFRFQPAALDGNPVRSRVRIPVAFRLSTALSPGESGPTTAPAAVGQVTTTTVAPSAVAAAGAGSTIVMAQDAEARAHAEAVAAAPRGRATTVAPGVASADAVAAAARAHEERARSFATTVAVAPSADARGGATVAPAPLGATRAARAAEVSAVQAARSRDAAGRSARAAEVSAAAARSGAARAMSAPAHGHYDAEAAMAALRSHHPELLRGSREPVTVFFVTDRSGRIQRSVVVPGSRLGAAGNRAADVVHGHASGGSAARGEVRRGVPGVDPDRVETVSTWRGRSLPEGVTVGWIVLRD